MTTSLPDEVVRAATGVGSARVADLAERPLRAGSGAATREVVRLSGTVTVAGRADTFSLVRKTVRQLSRGRHAEASKRLDHWAFWLREPLAYASGVLPSGPGLRAPRCFGVDRDTVYLEDVVGPQQAPDPAAEHLGRWQAGATVPSYPWLAGHQLEQRLAVTELDWSSLDVDPRAVAIWEARAALLDGLDAVPRVLSHGDYSVGNLLSVRDHTVALDWAGLGVSPAGADLAHLALSSLTDLSAIYLDAARGRLPAVDVLRGYRSTMALTGASRLHWMLTRGVDVPDGYVDFLWEHRPRTLPR